MRWGLLFSLPEFVRAPCWEPPSRPSAGEQSNQLVCPRHGGPLGDTHHRAADTHRLHESKRYATSRGPIPNTRVLHGPFIHILEMMKLWEWCQGIKGGRSGREVGVAAKKPHRGSLTQDGCLSVTVLVVNWTLVSNDETTRATL